MSAPAPPGWNDGLTRFHETAAGDDHYIDRASRLHTLQTLARHARPSGVILEIGCSSGFLLPLLAKNFPTATIIGADFVRAAKVPALPQVELLQFDLVNCPLRDASIDAAVLLNVLEHIEDDATATRQLARILKPGGIAVIEVPAGPGLFDLYDRQLMHFRRYRMKDLLAKIESAGLTVESKSHLGFFLYPAFWATKKWGRLRPPTSAAAQEEAVAARIGAARSNNALHALMRWEAALRERLYLPFGIRCLITCRKNA